MLDPLERQKLIPLLADGNPEAFRFLVRSYGPSVRAYIAARVFRMEEVDDLAQEVFLVAFRQRAEFSAVVDIGAWLRGIAANKILMHARSAARRADMLERFRYEVVEKVAAELDHLAANERSDVLDKLMRCVEQLPERLRRVIRAGLDGRKAMAIADEWGVALGTIYNLNSQAHSLLRKCLQVDRV